MRCEFHTIIDSSKCLDSFVCAICSVHFYVHERRVNFLDTCFLSSASSGSLVAIAGEQQATDIPRCVCM
jgi:hypothetical protein